MKELFKIKKTIASLSDDRIDSKPLFGLITVIALVIIPSAFGFGGDFIKIIKETLKPLQNIQGPEKLSVYFEIGVGLIFMFFVYIMVAVILTLILNWIVKKVLSLFKKDITLYKLLNITIYTLFINRFFRLIFISLLALATPILKNVAESQAEAIVFLPIILINLFGFGLYIYGIKISIRNKNKLINNSLSEN